MFSSIWFGIQRSACVCAISLFSLKSMEYAYTYMRWCVFVCISLPWRCLASCQSILLFGRLFHFRKRPNENRSKILVSLDFIHSPRLFSSFSVKLNRFSLASWMIVNVRVGFHISHRMCCFVCFPLASIPCPSLHCFLFASLYSK